MPTCYFFFNDTATTEIYTLSLHDALPISPQRRRVEAHRDVAGPLAAAEAQLELPAPPGLVDCLEPLDRPFGRTDLRRLLLRSEEHTSELQSRQYLVCRLLLEKKKTLPSS